MPVSAFLRIYEAVEKRRALTAALLGFSLVAALLGLKFIKYNNTIESMLPRDPSVQQTMRFLREANFSDKLVISLGLKDETRTTEDLLLAADQLAASIQSPLVKQVISNVGVSNVMSEMVSFLKYTPQLLGEGSQPSLSELTAPGGVQERLKFIYRQSLSPGSSFMMPFLRADPLGVSSGILRTIEKLSSSMGYEVVIKNGHLTSRDGRHAMLILKSPVVLTEGFGSRNLITYLKERLRQLPAYVSADIIAGHMHTVSNEDVIKRDIRLTTFIAAIAFLVLFLFFFRDPKVGMIFLIPLAAVVISTNITYFVFKNLSYFVIGLGTVIAGIAIDYGIYVYIAVRKAGRSPETIRQVTGPVVCGCLTTVSVFAVFFFSSVHGYQQLALFSNVSILICLFIALFILPHFLNKDNAVEGALLFRKPFFAVSGSKSNDRICVAIWGGILLIMAVSASGLRFKNDITQFDGAARDVYAAEEAFHDTFGGKSLPAIFVVSARSLEDAYQLNSDVYAQASKIIGGNDFISFASLWPGKETRKKNLSRWKEFWSVERVNELKKTLAEYGREYNFSSSAFEPLFLQLRAAENPEAEPKGFTFFDHLKEQFVVEKDGGYQVVSYFPDQEQYIAQLSALSKRFPGASVVSRKGFSAAVSHALASELVLLSILAVFLTVGLTFLLLRDARLATLSMVPIVTGIIMIAGIVRLCGLAVNMPVMIASMVVVGLVSDYGLFVVYYCRHKYETGTYMAVTLAAATTLIGAGVLLFARHPVLFSIGVTLVTGVLSGYLSSLLVIPPLYRLWISRNE